jgi:2-C-methyl-D-erythritol 4-phosphate cytidylyltransferase
MLPMAGSPSGKTARIAVLIPAAGSSARLRKGSSKILTAIGGTPLICHTAAVFRDHPGVERVVVIARKRDFSALNRAFAERAVWNKVDPLVEGGAERQESVRNGLRALEQDPPDWVLVHDGARPFCSPALLGRVVEALEKNRAVVPSLPIFDTVRRMGGDGSEVVERSALFRSQTPQGFHWELLRDAYRRARASGLHGTDDAQMVEAIGEAVCFVPGDERNFKITTEQDLRVAEWMLTHQEAW